MIGNRYFSIGVARGAHLRLEDSSVELTQADSASDGAGVLIENGTASLARVRISRSTEVALLARGAETEAMLADVAIGAGGDDGRTDARGVGIEANSGARVSGDRVAVADARYVAVAAFDEGSSVELRDASITGTRERGCSEAGGACEGFGAGDGVLAIGGGSVQLTRFTVADSARVGVFVGVGGNVALQEGELLRNPIGANLADPDFDVERIGASVRYVDNARNLVREQLVPPQLSMFPPAP